MDTETPPSCQLGARTYPYFHLGEFDGLWSSAHFCRILELDLELSFPGLEL